jgi:hypothetical protein
MLTRCAARPGSRDVDTLPGSVKQLVMHALVRPPGAPSHEIGALAKALSAELSRPPEPSEARAWRRARPRPPRGHWRFLGAGTLAIVISALVAWVTWSLVVVPRRPKPSEIPVVPAEEVVHPPSSVLGPAISPRSSDGVVGTPPSPPPVTPAGPLGPEHPDATTAPPSGVIVGPRAPRLSPPRSDRSAFDTPPPAPVESAGRRPDKPSRPAPESGSARPGPEEPDPTAIIDWLLQRP